jgi:hypothetical protein
MDKAGRRRSGERHSGEEGEQERAVEMEVQWREGGQETQWRMQTGCAS